MEQENKRGSKKKETRYKKLESLYKDPELYAQALFFEMQREQLMGDDFRIFHPVGEFVLTYDLFPLHVTSSVLIEREELVRLYLKFIDKRYKHLHTYIDEDMHQINCMWEKWGIEKHTFGARLKGKYNKNIYYIINKDHKLNMLEDK